eukprot:scaffold11234_cov57-Phaeocystis_antarctica.AAC.4
MQAQRHGAQRMASGQQQGSANCAYMVNSGRVALARAESHPEEAQEPRRRRTRSRGAEPKGGTLLLTMLRREWLLRRSRAVGIADDPHA